MSQFFVGQRVRIQWCVSAPELDGTEGVVVPLPTFLPHFDNSSGAEFAVSPDLWGAPFERINDDGTADWFGPYPDQLEPILDPGAAPSEYATLADLLTSLGTPVEIAE